MLAELPSLSAARSAEEAPELPLHAPHEGRRTAFGLPTQPLQRVQRPALLLPERSRLGGGARTGERHAHLEPVNELRTPHHAGGAQPGEQIVSLPLQQRAAKQREQPAPERALHELQPPAQREGNAVGAEHLRERRRERLRRAVHERDLPREHTAIEERPDLRRHQLQLGALAAPLEHPDRSARVDARAIAVLAGPVIGLEEATLEVAERSARRGGIVTSSGRHLDVAARPRQEHLEGARAIRERHAARLIVERHRHTSVHEPPERLDGVELDRREVVEAVEEDRGLRRALGTPEGGHLAQRIERTRVARIEVHQADIPHRPLVARVHIAKHAHARRHSRLRALPRVERLAQARRRDVGALQLAHQPRELARVSALQPLPARLREQRRDHPLARARGDHAAAEVRAPRHLLCEVIEERHAHSQRHGVSGELATVVPRIGGAGNDQPGRAAACEILADPLEDELRLARVRRAGDEREWHLCMLARASDICLRPSDIRPSRVDLGRDSSRL